MGGRTTAKSPSPAILALLAAIAPPPSLASPLSFLYPRTPRRPSKRWSAAAQEQAADIANHYTQGPHGNYHSSCWELHGQTNCPRDGDDLSDTLNVDPDGSVSDPIIDIPSATSLAVPSPTVTTPTSTTSAYTLDFDVKNVPDGWHTPSRSKLYSKPFILGFSVSLAAIILITIIACVIWKIKIAKSTQDLEKRVKAVKAVRTSSRTSSVDDPPGNDDRTSRSSTSLRRRQRNKHTNEKEDGDGSIRWSRGWAKASERWRINARLSAKRRKIGIVKISPSTHEEVNSHQEPTEEGVEQQLAAHARRPSLSATVLTSRRPSVDIRSSSAGPSPTFPSLATPLSPTSPTPESDNGATTPEHRDENYEPDQPRGTRRIYPDIPTVDDITIPPGQPRLHPPMIILSPPQLSLHNELEDSQDSAAVSPPAYRRRGFSLLSSAFASPSRSRPTRAGKEREAGLEYDDIDDTTPAEFSNLAVVVDGQNSGVTGPSVIHQTYTPLRRSVELTSQLPTTHEYDDLALSMDEDEVDSEEGDQRRLEATGHIATDEKDVLERIAVLRSQPDPSNGEAVPEATQLIAPNVSAPQEMDADGEELSLSPLSLDHADRDSVSLLPAPPVLTNAHRIPISSLPKSTPRAATIPDWHHPGPPPFDSQFGHEGPGFSHAKRLREKEGIGDWDLPYHSSTLEQPSAPPLLDEEENTQLSVPGYPQTSAFPSAPPLDDLHSMTGPSAPPDLPSDLPDHASPPTHASAPTFEDDEIEYVHDGR